ncbi:MAG: uroporphyrinogen decarboxylase family protein [Armatimonadota bacterium]
MLNIKKQPNFEEFLKVLKREGKPNHLPFYEHYASPEFIAEKTGTKFHEMNYDTPDYWKIYVNFWLDMGFDCVPMEIPLKCKLGEGHNSASEGSEAKAVIQNMEDFEKYDWPSETDPIDFSQFENAAKHLPNGAKIVGGVCMGPFEWVSQMMGVMGLSYAMLDCPELVDMMFEKIGNYIIYADTQIAQMDFIGALRQGDDLGFKTATFLSPENLRKYVFPTYKKMAEAAHKNNKPFILHSCGNLADVYEDIIEDCKIDAKHSFEDAIMPVGEFKKQYGKRITPLGGLDVDVICRADEDTLRKYTRKHIEECFNDGYWALGTGNSLTDYMPIQNYLICLDEGLKVTG